MWDLVDHELPDPVVVEHYAVLALERCRTQGHPTMMPVMPTHRALPPSSWETYTEARAQVGSRCLRKPQTLIWETG